MSNPSMFSIVIPVFMVEKYLRDCVQSVLAQTTSDYEIILVNDGSTDNCASICDEYSKTNPHVRVLHRTNGGLSAARNSGLEIATGRYVLFLDSDDYLDPHALAFLSPHVNDLPDIIAFKALRVESDSTQMLRPWLDRLNGSQMSGPEVLWHDLTERMSVLAAWLNAYRRTFLIDSGLRFKEGRLHEDEEWTPRALMAANSASICAEPIYFYRIRPGSITQQLNRSENARHIMDTVSELAVFYDAHPSVRQVGMSHLVGLYLQAVLMGSRSDARRIRRIGGWLTPYARGLPQSLKANLVAIAPEAYYYLGLLARRVRR